VIGAFLASFGALIERPLRRTLQGSVILIIIAGADATQPLCETCSFTALFYRLRRQLQARASF
jgi:hypothetical protein